MLASGERLESGVEALNERVLRGIHGWLAAAERCWLATVVRTYGSSPRPVGSLFAFNPRRGTLGSLSGGCIEEDLEATLASKADAPAELPELLRYGITQEEQIRYALPCGGELHILLEDLRPGPGLIDHFAQLLAALQQRKPVVRQVNLVSGAVSLLMGRTAAFSCDSQVLCHPLAPSHRLLLVGAGEVAFYVAQFAQTLDFEVTLCDPRESFFRSWNLPGVDAVQCLPDDLIQSRFRDHQCAILALAHDPRVDDMALLEALNTDAFYVGAMGSQVTSRQRRERLASLGLNDAQLNRLHAPIGLPIGSKTPAEIAISVVAHLVAERSRQRSQTASFELADSLEGESRLGCQVIPSSLRRAAYD